MTDAEQLLWSHLRRKQVHGVQFYRQKPLAHFIVDFYCASARLVIEVDGVQHHNEAGRDSDDRRTQILESLGLRVLRFDNRQVLLETDAVMEVIAAIVAGQIPPNPPFQRGERINRHKLAHRSNLPTKKNTPLWKGGQGGDLPDKPSTLIYPL